jgi:hypothetical protein
MPVPVAELARHRLAGAGDEGAPALADGHQAVVFEYLDGAAGGVAGDAELAHQGGDGRHAGTWRQLPILDAPAQDRGHLKIGRLGCIMVDHHVTTLDMPPTTWSSMAVSIRV